ncbi:SDR family oxidoreductase [Ramlibacter sp. XY19]|uniref:SDR family oxidoreductase n=1 Tax=Ramlibacter paludis TaxID=2908000 RepID=UPI0023DA62E6|nr:SDR family oxidoreductase [Ramlibacter paludis]MCG2591375.1 SDR family oxidoreductase [Ramlibacter paludis]
MNAAPVRTVLVTGAAKRLGRAIALELARAGWRVAVHHRGSDAAQTVADCGPQAKAFQADLSQEAQVRTLFAAVVQHYGTVDAVVNSASLFEHDNAQSFAAASLAKHMATNAAAPVLLAQALHEHVAARNGEGAVVNLLDQKLWNPNPDFFSYTLSKAALESATTLLAQALAPQLRVVGVAPGLTLTSHLLSQEKFEQLHKLSPLGRSSTPEDVAGAVRFALENRSITGTTLLVDGGQHLMKFERDFSLM